MVTRHVILMLGLLAGVSNAAEMQSEPVTGGETISRTPSIRPIPAAPRAFRFEPRPDITTHELEQLTAYLSGKPLYEEDQKALGSAMRHLKEVK